MTSKKKLHPMFAISGNHDYLRENEVKKLIQDHMDKGWKIRRVDGSDVNELSSALSSNFFFEDGSNTLVVVQNPEKANLNLLKSHYKDGNEDIVALLHYCGIPKKKTKFKEFLDVFGKSHKSFIKPADWKMEEAAVQFCIDEAKRRGKILPLSLAQPVVLLDGVDFGFLSFEIMKISILADIDGVDEITTDHLKKTLAGISDVMIVPVVEAVSLKNAGKIVRAMERVKKNSKSDPTMAVCVFLSNAVMQWLSVVDMRDKKISPTDEFLREIRLNQWIYKNRLLPQLRIWSRSELIKLIQIVSDSRRSVLSGSVNPWVVLSSRLLELCR